MVEEPLHTSARPFTKTTLTTRVFGAEFAKATDARMAFRGTVPAAVSRTTRAFFGAQSLPGIGASDEPDERQQRPIAERPSAVVNMLAARSRQWLGWTRSKVGYRSL
jgi:hypothetical protein